MEHAEEKKVIESIRKQLSTILIDKDEVIEDILVATLANGHVLLEDIPGIGKTVLVKGLAKIMGCSNRRIQFTPDLLPSDVTGVSIFNQKTTEFDFKPGPVMANVVLADEINRTSPKTQASLLEAMEEKQITVDGATYKLPEPFIVFATQNPIEHEGTYNLPEAQLDRFMIRCSIGYPSVNGEKQIINSQLKGEHPLERLDPEQTVSIEQLKSLQKRVDDINTSDELIDYIVDLVRKTREHPAIYLGGSPRAALALIKASKSKALLSGRGYVIPDDVKAMFKQVLGHRIILHTDEIMQGQKPQLVLREILNGTDVPVGKQVG
ncbi:MoxR family ATPase [Proteinivorax hydrogeniformans]|uniref:MoxR family ATPase n=1 Tax=Proteinivorax hydrogeniformans TaxID=1826727 RepID=A0AAU8HS77_9FIRM